MTTLPCPACGRTIAVQVPPGTRVQCPLCSQVVTVPVGAPPVPPGQLTSLDALGSQGAAGFPGPGMTYAGYGTMQQTSGLAVASLVCGIIGILGACVWGLGAIVAAVAFFLGLGAFFQIKKQPDRVKGKGLAIAGITTGLGGIALSICLWVAVFIPIMRGMKGGLLTFSNQIECQGQMQSLAIALQSYAQNDPKGMYPDSLNRLIKSGAITPQQLVCPSDDTGAMSYFYVPGYGVNDDPKQVIVYEHPDIHPVDSNSEFDFGGGSVIYADGEVEFVQGEKYKKLISRIKTPDGKRFKGHEE